MRKTLLLFTTMALTLLLAAGMAWAALPAPTVVSTVPPTPVAPALPPTNVDGTANIKAKFSEAMKETSINTSTFYLLEGHFTAANPPASCTKPPVPPSTIPVTAACPAAIIATVRYNDATKTAVLDPTASLGSFKEYTAVVEGTGDGDMKAVKDRGGTPLAIDYIFYFTTGSVGGNPGRGGRLRH